MQSLDSLFYKLSSILTVVRNNSLAVPMMQLKTINNDVLMQMELLLHHYLIPMFHKD